MKFSEASLTSTYRITGYDPLSIWINQRKYPSPIVLTAHELIEPWGHKNFSDWKISEVEYLVKLPVEMLLIGTGQTYQVLPQAIYQVLVESGKGFEIMDTAAACRTFNLLLMEARSVAAALFIG